MLSVFYVLRKVDSYVAAAAAAATHATAHELRPNAVTNERDKTHELFYLGSLKQRYWPECDLAGASWFSNNKC